MIWAIAHAAGIDGIAVILDVAAAARFVEGEVLRVEDIGARGVIHYRLVRQQGPMYAVRRFEGEEGLLFMVACARGAEGLVLLALPAVWIAVGGRA